MLVTRPRFLSPKISKLLNAAPIMLNWHQLDSHQQRVTTGVAIVVPVVVVLAAAPHWVLSMLVGIASAMGLWELQRMLFNEPLSRRWQALFFLAALVLPVGASVGGFAGLHGTLVATFVLGLLYLLFLSPLDPLGIARLAHFGLGWLYIPYLLSYVLLISRATEGTFWIFYTLSVTAADDIAAFYCGRKLGRHRLYEAVSPKKTIEGSLAGLLAGIVTGMFFGIVFLKGASIEEFLVLSG